MFSNFPSSKWSRNRHISRNQNSADICSLLFRTKQRIMLRLYYRLLLRSFLKTILDSIYVEFFRHFNKSSCFFFVYRSICIALFQKRFKRERKARMRMQQKLDAEIKRRNQIEDALKSSGAGAETMRLLSGKSIKKFLTLFVLSSSFVE